LNFAFQSIEEGKVPRKTMWRWNLFLLGLLAALCATLSEAFVVRPQVLMNPPVISRSSPLRMSDNEEDRLRTMGYSEEEIQRSRKQPDQEEIKVRVDLVPDVDPLSLTAVGFGLIALNFFVFANMGDGGIAGVLASIINTMNQ
jgi:hypothetical protein